MASFFDFMKLRIDISVGQEYKAHTQPISTAKRSHFVPKKKGGCP